ncbi:hypothetical protein Tco_1536516, partial [Tanacetum coccineum]
AVLCSDGGGQGLVVVTLIDGGGSDGGLEM